MHKYLPKGAIIKRVAKGKHEPVGKGWGRIPYPPPQPKPYVKPIPYALLKARSPLGRAPRLPKKPVSMSARYSKAHLESFDRRLPPLPLLPKRKTTMPHRTYLAAGAKHGPARRKIPACVLFKGRPHKVYVSAAGKATIKTYHKRADGTRRVIHHGVAGQRKTHSRRVHPMHAY